MNYSYCFLMFMISSFLILKSQDKKEYSINTIAFYNLENLFDTKDDPLNFDEDRTPDGKDHWTEERYTSKLRNLSLVLSEIGTDLSGVPPAIIGVCEIENRGVLEDLIRQEALQSYKYSIVHYDSPDRRGIDVAFLYRKEIFTPIFHKNYQLALFSNHENPKRIFTRDQLLVTGILDGEKIHFLVNHWPSRRGGEKLSRYKRIKAAILNRSIIDSIFNEEPYAKIITMGDLNDDPINSSVKDYLKTRSDRKNMKMKELYNPMERLYKSGIGTLAWRDSWNLFDQIIISSELLEKDYSSYRFYKAGVFNKSYLSKPYGRYKKYPFRSIINENSTGGYSDHFPVYIYLIKELFKE